MDDSRNVIQMAPPTTPNTSPKSFRQAVDGRIAQPAERWAALPAPFSAVEVHVEWFKQPRPVHYNVKGPVEALLACGAMTESMLAPGKPRHPRRDSFGDLVCVRSKTKYGPRAGQWQITRVVTDLERVAALPAAPLLTYPAIHWLKERPGAVLTMTDTSFGGNMYAGRLEDLVRNGLLSDVECKRGAHRIGGGSLVSSELIAIEGSTPVWLYLLLDGFYALSGRHPQRRLTLVVNNR
jgi:hypothetical protein